MPFVAPKSGRLQGGRGFLEVDNREAPEALRFPTGEGGAHLVIPAGQRLEIATLTCSHCRAVVVLNPRRTRDRGFCRRCCAFVCDLPGCHPDTGCLSIAEVLDLNASHPTVDWLARTPTGAPALSPQALAVRDRGRIF